LPIALATQRDLASDRIDRHLGGLKSELAGKSRRVAGNVVFRHSVPDRQYDDPAFVGFAGSQSIELPAHPRSLSRQYCLANHDGSEACVCEAVVDLLRKDIAD
jgi:hypothetical protein